MIDYALFKQALAMTESEDNPHAYGDEGLALGRWQEHPAFTLEWLANGKVAVGVDWSWDRVFAAALFAFFNHEGPLSMNAVQLAMKFHLGVAAVANKQWDTNYATRFNRFYSRVTMERADGV